MAQENIKLSPEIEQLSEKLSADPKSRVFAQLADAYRKAGLLDEAIDTAKKGMENHPNYAVAHLVLGRCYLAKGMYALAREEFELTIKSDPQNLVGYKLLGETYEKQNMYPEALKYYQMILDLEPADAELAQKIDDLKNMKQPEPEPAAEPAPIQAEPPVPAIETETQAPEETKEEAPAAPVEIPAMPEVLRDEEEPAIPSPPAEEMTLPPVLEQEPTEPETTASESPTAEAEQKAEAPAEPSLPPVQAEEAVQPQDKEEEKKDSLTETQGPTSTLAEIYVQQGFLEKAIDIYKELIAAQPDNEEYKTRMDELLAKAYPEEAPATEMPQEIIDEKAVEKEGLASPADIVANIPPALTQETAEVKPETVAAEDPFAKLFGQSSPVETPSIAVAPAPAEEIKPEPAAPIAEEKAPEKEPEPPAVDFGALFDQAPGPEAPAPAVEPEKPASEAKPAEAGGEGDDAVSSFQSWLSQIQK